MGEDNNQTNPEDNTAKENTEDKNDLGDNYQKALIDVFT